jgi:hypothetical protein
MPKVEFNEEQGIKDAGTGFHFELPFPVPPSPFPIIIEEHKWQERR